MCNHGVPFAQILWKKRQNLCRQSRTFNDEPKIFFLLKVVIDAIKRSRTFLFFAYFLHEYSPAKSPLNPRDHYPETMKICDPSLIDEYASTIFTFGEGEICRSFTWYWALGRYGVLVGRTLRSGLKLMFWSFCRFRRYGEVVGRTLRSGSNSNLRQLSEQNKDCLLLKFRSRESTFRGKGLTWFICLKL